MRIGLSGPHAIGKTTTALALCERLESASFVPSCASQIAKDMGFDLNKPFNDIELMDYQYQVFNGYLNAPIPKSVYEVYDRTPLDFAAYASLGCENNKSSSYLEFEALCVQCAQSDFDYIFIPMADLSVPFEDKHNRPKFSNEDVDYRSAFGSVILDLASNLSTKVVVIPAKYQHYARTDYILDIINGSK